MQAEAPTVAPDGFALPTPSWEAARLKSNYASRAMVLRLCVELALRVPGNIIEFGVASGASTRVIRNALRGSRLGTARKRIFALDSFEGLREPYAEAKIGTFAGSAPRVPGVNFIKGYFEGTCTEELRGKVGRVAFAHLDADLYSSTLFALHWLTPLLGTGSILLFDEFVGGKMDEARAFSEWRQQCGIGLIRIAEFDRDPSGFGSVVDRRLVFQVLGSEDLPRRRGKESTVWKLAYYLGRLGFKNTEAKLLEKL